MSMNARGMRRIIGGLAISISVAIAIFMLFPRDVHYFVEKLHIPLRTSNIDHPSTQKVLLPAGFRFPEQLMKQIQGGSSDEQWDYIQLNITEKLNIPPRKTKNFKKYDTFLYGQSETPDCSRAARLATFSIDESRQLALNFTKIFEIFSEETSTYQDGFNQRIESIIKEYMIQENQHLAWYRYSGSSVWLKDYNVHYVVSRLVLSKRKLRNFPTISLLLAQVYDESWNELEGVHMVLPSNTVEDSPSFEVDGQSFIVHRFPKILPIPFDIGDEKEAWGAEDPRTLLVRNKNGYEEPVVVYNSLHASEIKKTNKLSSPYQRSISMAFPFQIQRGLNSRPLDGMYYPNDWFSRSKRLSIKGQTPMSIEKNWTPFVSQDDLFDKHIMFAVQLEPLSIIKCELLTNNGECVIDGTPNKKKVGALRGGTPLLSLKLDKEQDKEYFFGFARAHLQRCGCGDHFYRPNLIVLLRQGASWKLTHITSSIDLGMKITSWRLRGGGLCEGNNAMIPNGIEYFDHESDTLTLLLSISDFTVERVHVKGVLKALEAAKLWETKTHVSPVPCALKGSKAFCQEYGDKIGGRIPGRFG